MREGGESEIPERPGEILPRVLMDFGLFESLLAIKLTACCASSTAPLSSVFIPAQTKQADDTKGSAHVCLTTPPLSFFLWTGIIENDLRRRCYYPARM